VQPRHQGGTHGGRAPAKIVRAVAKITGLIIIIIIIIIINRFV